MMSKNGELIQKSASVIWSIRDIVLSSYYWEKLSNEQLQIVKYGQFQTYLVIV